MPKRRNNTKRGHGRKSRGPRRGNGRKVNRNTKNKIDTVRMPLQIPDQVIETFHSFPPPENIFATAVVTDSLLYYMTGVINIKSGTNAVFDYSNLLGHMYQKARCLKSRVKFVLSSREAVNYQTVVLVPILTASQPTNAATFQQLAALPFAKKIVLGPLSSGSNSKTLSMSFSPKKLVGKQYDQQDEYAGSFLTGSDPATLLYWQLMFYNPSVNTVTTGGIVVQVEMFNTYLMYELQRDSVIAFTQVDTVDHITDGIRKLTVLREERIESEIEEKYSETSRDDDGSLPSRSDPKIAIQLQEVEIRKAQIRLDCLKREQTTISRKVPDYDAFKPPGLLSGAKNDYNV